MVVWGLCSAVARPAELPWKILAWFCAPCTSPCYFGKQYCLWKNLLRLGLEKLLKITCWQQRGRGLQHVRLWEMRWWVRHKKIRGTEEVKRGDARSCKLTWTLCVKSKEQNGCLLAWWEINKAKLGWKAVKQNVILLDLDFAFSAWLNLWVHIQASAYCVRKLMH